MYLKTLARNSEELDPALEEVLANLFCSSLNKIDR